MTHRPSPFRIGDAPSAALRTVWAPTPTGGRAQDRATAVHAGALGAVSAVDSQDGPGDIGGSGLARKTTPAAISSGLPYLPKAVVGRNREAASLSAGFISVSTNPA